MAQVAKTGTYTIGDLLIIGNTSIAAFGEDTVAEVLNRDLALFNARVSEMLSQLAIPITEKVDRIARYGTSIEAEMTELDEFGQPTARKAKPGVNVGFPLRKFGVALGWTRDYMLNSTPADVAIRTTKIQKAYLRSLHKEVRKTIFRPTNYTFEDRFVDELQLPVKAFLNADGAAIPDGPNGEEFAGATHTHFLAVAGGVTNAKLLELVDTVTEHGHTSGVMIYINKANEAAVRGLADFEAYPDPRITFRATDTATKTLDLRNMGNRAIGIFHEAEVWVKPWIPSGYYWCWAEDAVRPLKFRQHHVASVRGLRIAFEMDDYPLRAEIMESYFGFGVWERTNGAVLDANNASYTQPTITN